jgi:hypothetical protein
LWPEGLNCSGSRFLLLPHCTAPQPRHAAAYRHPRRLASPSATVPLLMCQTSAASASWPCFCSSFYSSFYSSSLSNLWLATISDSMSPPRYDPRFFFVFSCRKSLPRTCGTARTAWGGWEGGGSGGVTLGSLLLHVAHSHCVSKQGQQRPTKASIQLSAYTSTTRQKDSHLPSGQASHAPDPEPAVL